MRICATLQLLTIRVLTPSRFRAAPQEESLQAPRPSLSLSLSLSQPPSLEVAFLVCTIRIVVYLIDLLEAHPHLNSLRIC